VNPVTGQRVAVKPRQLDIAHRIGLRIPDTLISNDPAEVEAFLQRHEKLVVHKALTAPAHAFIDTQLWKEENLSTMRRDLPIAPTIFQEYVCAPADIRATIIGDRIFAARLATAQSRAGSVDSRLDMDVPYEPHQLPTGLGELLLRLMSELGLVSGTVDLKMINENEYVFLEVNPQGQFLYVEILTGMPITSALADFLASA
jgi:glutathione synthase/RimK-type ligase-like ATP-grasp enzyme